MHGFHKSKQSCLPLPTLDPTLSTLSAFDKNEYMDHEERARQTNFKTSRAPVMLKDHNMEQQRLLKEKIDAEKLIQRLERPGGKGYDVNARR